ncbi:MAG: GNAT family N-acetyltransferase [Verrucomicrobiales bacterium]|nr:GNAT family N-acetyltransferase [Verrucomicrobiales bacterium]
MSTFSQDSFQIRPVSPEDLPELLAMIRELADFERLTHLVTATEADYHESLFGETPAAEALLAEENGRPVGYAVYFSTFSTFVGRAGVWLEDLYVRPDHRGKGYGKALLKAVGAIAHERGAGRYEWTVLDWNQQAIDLYERAGGEILPEWRIVRMDGDRLRAFAES